MMGKLTMFQAQPAPPAAIMRIMSQMDRTKLEGFIECAIALLDVTDGDADAEDDGDAQDHNCAEDELIGYNLIGGGPGCNISDPGGCEHDGREPDVAF